MDLAAAKNEINFRLDREIMGGVDAVPDRLRNEDAFKPILDEVAKEGWALSETLPGEFRISRAYVLRVTRSSEHQKLVEDRGEVAAGNNTYDHPHSTQFPISKTFRYASEEGVPDSGLEITDALMAQALICLAANSTGPRPVDRVRDL